MRFLTLPEVLEIHRQVIAQTGGAPGIRDLGALESAVAQPRQTFGGEDLYPTLAEKSSALAFSLIQNHPFVDGNKRTGHAALETFLMLNGHELHATVDEAERVILGVAASRLTRENLVRWIQDHLAAL